MDEVSKSLESRVSSLERSALRWKALAVALGILLAVRAFIFAGPAGEAPANQMDQLKVGTLTANHILVVDPSGHGGRVIISANDKAANLIVAGFKEAADHSRQFAGGECAITAGGDSSTLHLLTSTNPDLADFDEHAKDPEGISMAATRAASLFIVSRKGQPSKGFTLQPSNQ